MSRSSNLLRVPGLVVMIAVGAVGITALSDDGGDLESRKAALLSAIDFEGLSNSLGVGMLRDPFPESRRMAARALASDADPKRLRLLAEYAGDTDAWTRYHAIVAAGRMGPPGLGIALRGLKDSAPVVRQAAVWAACHGGEGAFDAVTDLLLTERDTSVLETAVANLWRFSDLPWESHAANFSDRDNPGLRRAAASTLARSDRASRSEALRRLAADSEPVIRATAVDGYGRGPISAADQKVVIGAVSDGDWRVQAAACGVLAVRQDLSVPAEAARAVEGLWSSPRGQLAVPALRAAGRHRGIGDDETLRLLAERAEPWPAAQALQALARRGSGTAVAISSEWINSGETWRRRAAAQAAAILPKKDGEDLLRRVVADPEPAVRLAWLESLDPSAVSGHAAVLWTLVRKDPDPMVRAQCVDLLGDAGELSVRTKALELYRAWAADDAGDARAAALSAALDLSDADEQRSVLEMAKADRNRLVTAMVVKQARQLGLEGTVNSGDPRHGRKWYRDLVGWETEQRWLDVVTVRGTFRIKLELEEAPITSREIWDLADGGYYDGLTFHRVVPNFVVQGGDPRGDGWGGPGFVIPDEPSLRPFDSWRVGIATSGPQTGGCQFFFMLLPSDRLTGHYTNFGEVVAGREILTRLQVGDRIVRIETATGPEPPPPPPVLLGHLGWQDLQALDGWEEERSAYQPDPAAIEHLTSTRSRYRVITVLGTWCSDSELEVPRLVRVLQDVGGDRFELVMVGVDRTKRVADSEVASIIADGSAVDRVPTIVVLDETGEEIGRIVETADHPIEELLTDFVADTEGWR